MGNKTLSRNSEDKVFRSKRLDKPLPLFVHPRKGEGESKNIETEEMMNLMKSFGKLTRQTRCNNTIIKKKFESKIFLFLKKIKSNL